jgi:hypothetical protein
MLWWDAPACSYGAVEVDLYVHPAKTLVLLVGGKP